MFEVFLQVFRLLGIDTFHITGIAFKFVNHKNFRLSDENFNKRIGMNNFFYKTIFNV